MTLEDETGIANVIVWSKTFERYRKVVLAARLVLVEGELQREGIVTHVIAHRIHDLSEDLDALADGDAAERGQPGGAPGDAARHGPPDSRAPDRIAAQQTSRRLPEANPRRHPRDAHIRIISRDFH